MPRGVINPLNNPVVAEGVPQPVHNQNLLPQIMEAPLASGVSFPPQDSYQAQRIVDSLPSTAQRIHSLVAAQNQSYLDQGRQIHELQHLVQQHEACPLNFVPGRYGTTPAFCHQFDMVGIPGTPYQTGGRRTNSFDRGAAMHGRQEFLAGMHAGHYDRVNSRRPTVASQGSFDGNLRRWNSHSPQRQPQHFYASSVEQWQQNTTYGQGNAAYGAPYGGSRRQSYQSHSRDHSAGQIQWRTPDRSHHNHQISPETSPRTSRNLSPAKVLEPTGSKTPRKFVPAAQNDDSYSVSSADHSHPVAVSPMPSSSMSVDMLGEWGRRHTPNASERRNSRLSDLDVPTFKLDEAVPSTTPSVKPAWTPSLTATAGPVPPHLRWTEDSKPPTIPSSYEYTKSDDNNAHLKKFIESKKPSTNQQGGGRTKRLQADTATSSPSKKTFDSSFSSGDSVKMADVDVGRWQLDEAPERVQENEWQVAGPRMKKTGKEPTTQRPPRQKGAQKKLKEDQPRREPGSIVPRKTHKDKVAGDDTSQQREISTRGVKTKRPKKEASGEGHDEYPSQSQNTGNPYGGRRSKKGKGKEVENDSSIFEQSYLPDLVGEAFPSLSPPAAARSTTASVQSKDDADDAELVKMSWSSALKAQDFRVEAEKVRVAAAIPIPVDSRDASGSRRMSPAEINVSATFSHAAQTFTSAAGGTRNENALTVKHKTPAPKGRASSGDLRATATPFTPPPAGQSLLITGSEMDFSGMLLDADSLVPTWAVRAALAVNISEQEAAVPPVLQLTSAERKSVKNAAKRATRAAAVLASENGTAISVGPPSGSRSGARAPSVDFGSELHTAQKKDLNKLSLSEHTMSMSVPTSTAGSVSSPSLASVKSMPSTPAVRTWADRAASAALHTASPSTAKAECPLVHSGNISTPKSDKGPQPGPITPATSVSGSSITVYPSEAKSNLSATASAFSYAARLAAPAPPSRLPIPDAPSKEGVDAKTANAKSVPSGVRAPEKKGGKDKVCDSPNDSSHFSTARKTTVAKPLVSNWDQKTRSYRSDGKRVVDRHTLRRLTDKQKKKSASPNGRPPTIDASLMMVTSPDSDRASFASTATTSASSTTLVSSETLSSEDASSAGVRDNTDVGGSQIVRTKGPYRPASDLPENGYNAPPPTPSPAETWAQRTRQRSSQTSLMDRKASSESIRESTLTTCTGPRQVAGSGADKRWIGEKPGRGGDVARAAFSISVQKISQPLEVVKIQEEATSRRGHRKGSSDDHEEGSHGQGESQGNISSHVATLDAAKRGDAAEGDDEAEGDDAHDDTAEEAILHNTTGAEQPDPLDSALSVPSAGPARYGRESRSQSPKKIPKQQTPFSSAMPLTRRAERKVGSGRAAHVRDIDTFIKAGASKSKQAEAVTSSTSVNEGYSSDGSVCGSGAGEAVKSKDNAGYESDDSTGTVKGTPAPLEFSKLRKAELKKSEATVPDTSSKKIMWADADDEEDEWAGFEAMTTPDLKKLELGEKSG